MTSNILSHPLKVRIRREQKDDAEEIRLVHDRAFGQPEEGRIVEKLRHSCSDLLSLVAIAENRIVGHILFSPATIDGPHGVIQGMGLAPMAVLPEYQRQGIGTKLIHSAITLLKDSSCPFIIVLGHEEYYPRFGFSPASNHGLKCQWEGVPDNAFMALMLDKSVMDGISGVVKYRDEFNEVMEKPNNDHA